MSDESQHKHELLDSKISQALRNVAPPAELEHRLLDVVEVQDLQSGSRPTPNSDLAIPAQRSIQLERMLMIATSVVVVAASVYFFADGDSRRPRLSDHRDRESVREPQPGDAILALDELAQTSMALRARLSWLELRQRQLAQQYTSRPPQLDEDFWKEQTAGTIVLAADMQRRLSNSAEASATDYKLVIEHFANSHWALVARDRLSHSNHND